MEAFINRLYWLDHQDESEDLRYFLNHCNTSTLCDAFKLHNDVKNAFVTEYKSLANHEILKKYGKSGFLAEVYHPELTGFSELDGELFSYCKSNSRFTIFYIYGETIEDLMKKIKLKARIIFNRYYAKDGRL